MKYFDEFEDLKKFENSILLNQIKSLNQFIHESNLSLSIGGYAYFVFETYSDRKNRLKENFLFPFNYIIVLFDTIFFPIEEVIESKVPVAPRTGSLNS